MVGLIDDWSIPGYWTRYAVMLSFVASAGILLVRKVARRKRETYKPLSKPVRIIAWLYGAAAAYLLIVNTIFAATMLSPGGKASSQTLEIDAPMREGLYAVVHGGFHTAVNYHYAFDSQKYA